MKSQNPTLENAVQFKTHGIIVGLSVALLVSWAVVLWSRNNYVQQRDELVRQYKAISESREQLHHNYDASLSLLDSISGTISLDEKALLRKDIEIAGLKHDIAKLLNKQNLTVAEKARAASLISELNTRIYTLGQEIILLTSTNEKISEEKSKVMIERDQYRMLKEKLEWETKQLELKIGIASTLNTSSITVTPLKVKKGGSGTVTKNAGKADKFVVAFDVHNRVIAPGKTDIFIMIQDPEGNIVKTESLGSGVFVTAENNEQPFTAVIPVMVETGSKKRIEFAWSVSKKLKRGNYYVAIYHNGFKIGETTTELKKGMFVG